MASTTSSLAQFLKIENYPTLVFASSDGRVLGSQVGFLEAPALREILERVVNSQTEPEWMLRSYADALKAREAGDFAGALTLLKRVLQEGRTLPVQVRSLQLAQELEQLLSRAQADQAARTAASRESSLARPSPSDAERPSVPHVVSMGSAAPGQPPGEPTGGPGAGPALAAGTPAAPPKPELSNPVRAPGGQALPAMPEGSRAPQGTLTSRSRDVLEQVNRTDSPEQIRVRQAKDLLAQAREDYQQQRYLACLDRCEMLLASYHDLSSESLAAMQMSSEIKKNPEWIKLACDQLGDRLSLMYLGLAETWLAKGEPQQAIFYLERVIQTAPNTRYAETATVRLTQLQGQPLPRSNDPRK